MVRTKKSKKAAKKQASVKTPRLRAVPVRNRNISISSVGPQTQKLGQSLANPFSFAGCIPDGALGVGCFSAKQETALTTGTGTCSLLAVSPNFAEFYYLDSTSAAQTPTVTGNWVAPAAVATMVAMYKSYRPISMGMRGVYVGNTSTDQGVILVGVLATGVALSALNAASITTAAALCRSYKILPLRGGFECYWRPEDIVDTANFVNTTSTVSASSVANTVPTLVAIVYGASTGSTVLQTEIVANWEGQFTEQTFLPGGIEDSTRKPAELGWYEKALNIANQFEQIAPMVYAGYTGYNKAGLPGVVSAISQVMGNGYAYPRVDSQSMLDRSRRSLLTY